MLALAALCIFPIIHVFSISLSSSTAATAGKVIFWPVDITWESYSYVLKQPEFITSVGVTLKRLVLGVIINMLLTIITAYPLSKERRSFPWRTTYAWIFVVTILFSGGLIPVYMLLKNLGLLNSIWALVLPTALPVFNVLLLLNFFRGLPKELEEAAFMDGAGHWKILWRIFVPLSAPALATVTLFVMVGHWNSWFDGLIYMNSTNKYPLQSYLRTIIISRDLTSLTLDQAAAEAIKISDRTLKAAQIFLGALPILLVYPFLQRYFMKGIVLGSVKE
jgi:putative aldouronate transport system permease protein